jgi:hypothetical protein
MRARNYRLRSTSGRCNDSGGRKARVIQIGTCGSVLICRHIGKRPPAASLTPANCYERAGPPLGSCIKRGAGELLGPENRDRGVVTVTFRRNEVFLRGQGLRVPAVLFYPKTNSPPTVFPVERIFLMASRKFTLPPTTFSLSSSKPKAITVWHAVCST